MMKRYIIKMEEVEGGTYKIPDICFTKDVKVSVIAGYNVVIVEADDTNTEIDKLRPYAITEEEYEKIKQEFDQKMKVMRGEIVNE